MTKPKLLFDENLSFRLVELLAEPFPGVRMSMMSVCMGARKADVESFVQEAETALLAIQMEREYP
jgi:hypothetical protein